MKKETILSPLLSLRTKQVWKLRIAPLTMEDLALAMRERWSRRIANRRFKTEHLFSDSETRHRLQTRSDTVYTRCALDGLIILQVMGGSARLSTSCPHCGEPITAEAKSSRLVFSHPQAVLSWGLAKKGSGPAHHIACPFINLFPSWQHYLAWAENTPEAITMGLSFEEMSGLLRELAGSEQEARQARASNTS